MDPDAILRFGATEDILVRRRVSKTSRSIMGLFSEGPAMTLREIKAAERRHRSTQPHPHEATTSPRRAAGRGCVTDRGPRRRAGRGKGLPSGAYPWGCGERGPDMPEDAMPKTGFGGGLLLGAAVGAGAALLGPLTWRAARPLAKTALRAGIKGLGAARVAAAQIGEEVEDLVAEVQHELDQAAPLAAAQERGEAADACPPAAAPPFTA